MTDMICSSLFFRESVSDRCVNALFVQNPGSIVLTDQFKKQSIFVLLLHFGGWMDYNKTIKLVNIENSYCITEYGCRPSMAVLRKGWLYEDYKDSFSYGLRADRKRQTDS